LVATDQTDTGRILDSLDVALFAFALVPPESEESNSAALYRELIFARTTKEGLRRSADREAVFAAHRLRVALQLAPLDAISYTTTNPTARWKIIQRHLAMKYPHTGADLVTQLARRVAVTLADWQEPRGATTSHHRAVWLKSGGRCSSCHYDFTAKNSPALLTLDPFKLYYQSPEELTAPEIDHIVAISGVGTNELANLQLLCRWCNFGKGDGLGVDIRREAEYAALGISEIPRGHIASMFYMTLADNDFSCETCRRGQHIELTIRLRDSQHGFLLSNLVSTCYECT
jgi:hypothetical protein